YIFFSTHTATTYIYTLSLHDALPILLKVKITENQLEKEQAFDIRRKVFVEEQQVPIHIEMDEHDDSAIHFVGYQLEQPIAAGRIDRKSTRLNSSHVKISYAVFCLKKK